MKIFVIDDDPLSIFVTKNMLELENITQDIHIFFLPPMRWKQYTQAAKKAFRT